MPDNYFIPNTSYTDEIKEESKSWLITTLEDGLDSKKWPFQNCVVTLEDVIDYVMLHRTETTEPYEYKSARVSIGLRELQFTSFRPANRKRRRFKIRGKEQSLWIMPKCAAQAYDMHYAKVVDMLNSYDNPADSEDFAD